MEDDKLPLSTEWFDLVVRGVLVIALGRDFLIDGRRSLIWAVRLGD